MRRFSPADIDWLARLYADPEVTRHVGGPRNRAAVAEFLDARVLQYYDEHPGLGLWMTIERRTGKPVGFHNLNHIQGESFIQVGFMLLKEGWGRGFASEMALALLGYGFIDLGLPHIVGMTGLNNLPAQRVLRNIGLARNGERAFPAYASAGRQAWFERHASDWLAERGELPDAESDR